ncbi:MAG: uroporphyrinogen decarboxylase family protein [Bacillota bacterium]|nr:uroporphyrinogen decarboxylase family protein [Bacillota bacterium]
MLNSRERLLAVLKGEMPDRVPINTLELQGYKADDWYNKQPKYKELMDYIRKNTDGINFWYPYTGQRIGDADKGVGRFLTSTKDVKEEVRNWRDGENNFTEIVLKTPKGDLRMIERSNDLVNTVWVTEHFVKDISDLEKVLSIPYEPFLLDTSSLAQAQAEIGDHGIITADIGDPLIYIFDLFDFSNFLIFAISEEKKMHQLLEMYYERIYNYLEHLLKNGAGPLVRIYGPEAATPPYLPNRLFKDYVFDYDKKLIDLIHKYDCYCRVHAHGRVGQVLEYIAEMGADAVDPVEAPPSGDIELKEAKEIIGDRVTIFGNIQLHDLELRTEQEMIEITKRTLEQGAPDGRFVLMPTAAPLDTDLKERTMNNYLAMIDTALTYGKY